MLRAETSLFDFARFNIATALRAAIALFIVLLSYSTASYAQQLPIRRYDVTDGLPDSSPKYLLQDSKGYLWFASLAVICRFDGYRFACFDGRNQFGDYVLVNSVAEDKRGRIWISVEDGAHREAKWIARLIDAPREAD
jgi:ligand-binding sensor domain-containing protein